MTILSDPPLIEAIFQLCWGEVVPGHYSYTQEEQSLFAGKISASAFRKGYPITEGVQQGSPVLMPMVVTHRFRKGHNEWPCYQVGLGVFTVNQIKNGYDWVSFKDAINIGLEMLEEAESDKLNSISDTLSIVLTYQDAFFPESIVSIEKYLKDNFRVNASLPDEFLNNSDIARDQATVNINFNVETSNPKGNVSIRIANAIINDRPGLLMETIIQSKARELVNDKLSKESILDWVERAHVIQKHSFKTLINPSAYQ